MKVRNFKEVVTKISDFYKYLLFKSWTFNNYKVPRSRKSFDLWELIKSLLTCFTITFQFPCYNSWSYKINAFRVINFVISTHLFLNKDN